MTKEIPRRPSNIPLSRAPATELSFIIRSIMIDSLSPPIRNKWSVSPTWAVSRSEAAGKESLVDLSREIPKLKVCLLALHRNLPQTNIRGMKKPKCMVELLIYSSTPYTPWCSKWFCLCLSPQRHSKEGEHAASFKPVQPFHIMSAIHKVGMPH